MPSTGVVAGEKRICFGDSSFVGNFRFALWAERARERVRSVRADHRSQ